MKSPTPSAATAARPSFLPRDGREPRIDWMRILPTMDTAKMPPSQPTSRMLSRMSRWNTWLNSCAITPCSSSRESSSMQPRVTPITASFSEFPAANALMEASSIR